MASLNAASGVHILDRRRSKIENADAMSSYMTISDCEWISERSFCFTMMLNYQFIYRNNFG